MHDATTFVGDVDRCLPTTHSFPVRAPYIYGCTAHTYHRDTFVAIAQLFAGAGVLFVTATTCMRIERLVVSGRTHAAFLHRLRLSRHRCDGRIDTATAITACRRVCGCSLCDWMCTQPHNAHTFQLSPVESMSSLLALISNN
jgi:hypothetical protein